MKFLPLIWAGLWRKRMRTVLTLLAVVTAFVLFGLLENVSDGFRQIEARSPEDRLVVTGAFSKRITIAAVEQVRRVPGVMQISFVSGIFGVTKDPRQPRGVNFVEDDYFDMLDDVIITRAQRDELARTRDGIVVTRGLAKEEGLKIGDRYNLTAPPSIKLKDGTSVWSFQIVGIVDSPYGDTARFGIGNYAYYAENRPNPTVGAVFAKIADPKDAVRIGKEIDKLFQNSDTPTRTGSQRAFTQSGLGSLGNVEFLVNAVALGVMFMLLFLTANVLMQSVRERAPEFAVLTILGFSPEGVFGIVVAEAIALCLIGAAIGMVGAAAAAPLISLTGAPHAPTLTLRAIGLALVAAILVGSFSCVMPLWRMRRMSTVDVLAGR